MRMRTGGVHEQACKYRKVQLHTIWFFVRDMVESFELEVPFVSTHDNAADILTKAMKDAKQFHRLRKILMNDRHE